MLEADTAFVHDLLKQSYDAVQAYKADPVQIELLDQMAARIVGSLRAGGKLLIMGNGGSAGDAQHIAAEFTGRMLYDRAPLPAVALTTDTSALTAIANDYGFERVFERQVVALGRRDDVLLGLSTSGNSPNISNALEAARLQGMVTLGFSGADGGAMARLAELTLRAPTRLTPIVQQIHMIAGHILSALVERALFPREDAAPRVG